MDSPALGSTMVSLSMSPLSQILMSPLALASVVPG